MCRMAALWAGKAHKESIHTAVVQPTGKGGGGGSAVFIGPENGGAVCRRLRCEAEAGKAKAAVPPVRLVRKPEGGAVLQLRPVAVGREEESGRRCGPEGSWVCGRGRPAERRRRVH